MQRAAPSTTIAPRAIRPQARAEGVRIGQPREGIRNWNDTAIPLQKGRTHQRSPFAGLPILPQAGAPGSAGADYCDRSASIGSNSEALRAG